MLENAQHAVRYKGDPLLSSNLSSGSNREPQGGFHVERSTPHKYPSIRVFTLNKYEKKRIQRRILCCKVSKKNGG